MISFFCIDHVAWQSFIFPEETGDEMWLEFIKSRTLKLTLNALWINSILIIFLIIKSFSNLSSYPKFFLSHPSLMENAVKSENLENLLNLHVVTDCVQIYLRIHDLYLLPACKFWPVLNHVQKSVCPYPFCISTEICMPEL